MAAIGAGGSLALVGDAMALQAPVEALKVSVVLPELYNPDGKLAWPSTIRNAGYGFKFFVVVENVSTADLYIWSESNSTGISALSFEVTGPDGARTVVKRIPIDWSKNILRAERIAPGGFHVRAIETPHWENFPFGAKDSRREVTLRAVFEQARYEVPKKNEAEKLAIWSGKVVSAPYKVVLLNA
jgi:hypothetical protein